MQSVDPASAYLGPQLWDEMLLSDDLKLQPVNLDELLGAAVDDEVTFVFTSSSIWITSVFFICLK